MSWNFQDIKYGWKILAGVALTGTTIFVADNIIQRIYARDMIQIVLGTYERCLATQYSTNPVSYYVSPTNLVRSWYSNSYETTNIPGDLVTNWTAVLHTNIFTNIFGWRTDRAMMVELDTKIKALVPYYCDTNTVYDGTTNIVMLTVTGLWASLGIGDGTNQFTSVPEWVGTNGVTNAATYGDLPWRIYKEDLEERYKVLNALKIVRFWAVSFTNDLKDGTGSSYSIATNDYFTSAWQLDDNEDEIGASVRYIVSWYMMRVRGRYIIPAFMNTNVGMSAVSLFATVNRRDFGAGWDNYYWNELGLEEGSYIRFIYLDNPQMVNFPYTMENILNNTDDIPPDPGYPTYPPFQYGWKYVPSLYIDWNFQYCTNKYW